MNFTNLIGKNTTPASRITSAIVSLIVLSLIYLNVIPKIWFGFLAFHLINHFYLAVSDLKLYVCPKCDKSFESKRVLKKHKCKK